jgi:hypothetical protein
MFSISRHIYSDVVSDLDIIVDLFFVSGLAHMMSGFSAVSVMVNVYYSGGL